MKKKLLGMLAIVLTFGVTTVSYAAEQRLNLSQARGLFIESVGQMNAGFFPLDRFTWDDVTETLSFRSRARAFTGTGFGLTHSPISFYKEMVVEFDGSLIWGAAWRYVYISADPWFQLGLNVSDWFFTAVPGNGVTGTGMGGVINTLIHFERLQVNNTYTFRRGGGSNTTLTVRQVAW